MKNMGKQTVKGTKYYGSQWGPAIFCSPPFFKISYFVFNRRNSYRNNL